jgi:PD-(D/E)XK nuclease family transposase
LRISAERSQLDHPVDRWERMTEIAQGRRRTLDPRLDIVFNLLFGAEQNRQLLIALLNDVLRPSTAIVSVQVLPPAPEAGTVEDKLIFLDLRVRLQSGEQVDVEMQTRRHPALRPRVLFYWGRMYIGQLKRGDSYSGLQRCVVVLITDFDELPGSRFHSLFQARERRAAPPASARRRPCRRQRVRQAADLAATARRKIR